MHLTLTDSIQRKRSKTAKTYNAKFSKHQHQPSLSHALHSRLRHPTVQARAPQRVPHILLLPRLADLQIALLSPPRFRPRIQMRSHCRQATSDQRSTTLRKRQQLRSLQQARTPLICHYHDDCSRGRNRHRQHAQPAQKHYRARILQAQPRRHPVEDEQRDKDHYISSACALITPVGILPTPSEVVFSTVYIFRYTVSVM